MDTSLDSNAEPTLIKEVNARPSYQLAIVYFQLLCVFQLQTFRVDEEDCTFGMLMSKGFYKPKSNFIMELATYVEAASNSGYFVYITRRSDRLKK